MSTLTTPLVRRWLVAEKETDDLIDQLLINRGVDVAHKELFLAPNFDRDFHDPYELLNMTPAVARFVEEVKSSHPVGIFSDYDADGVPGAALLHNALKLLGKKSETYIPTRQDGYGLQEKGLTYLKDRGVRLVVAIDLGVTGKKAVAIGKKMGLDFIIIDHHLVQKSKLPTDAIVINPKQEGDIYPEKELCACALVYKFIWALSKALPLSQSQLKWLIDLPTISTVADMVPLLGENRLITKFGLPVLDQTKNPGIAALIASAGIMPPLNPYHIGFQIAPRINAPGRMMGPQQAYSLLIASSQEEATALALEIETVNRDRQQSVQHAVEAAIAEVEEKSLHRKKIVIVGGPWIPGIWGLIAARLVERYYRPALVFGTDETPYRGSGRSVDGVHLIDTLSEVSDCLVEFGGHAKACGFSLKPEAVDEFSSRLEKLTTSLPDELFSPLVKIDALLPLNQITSELANQLTSLAPFGLGNPRPVFMASGVSLSDIRLVGNGEKHLKAKADDLEVIGFGLGDRVELVRAGKIDLAYQLEWNHWNGSRSLQLKVNDIRQAVNPE